jgi:hypothetical protein
MKQRFEPKLVKQLNEFFDVTKTKAIAYRLRPQQGSYGYQNIDILVDGEEYYLGIECKSVLVPSQNKIYFRSHFTTDSKGIHQVTRINDFLSKSGRKGICAIELRDDTNRKIAKTDVRFMPWREVAKIYESGAKAIEYEEVRAWPQYMKVKGVFNLDACLETCFET